jgi:hypothetical protein
MLLLLVTCCSAPWVARWHGANERRAATNTIVSEEPPRAAEFDHMFVPVAAEVWADRETVLADESLREIVERVQVAGLSPDELSRERARLGDWLEAHRAETAVDLLGAWHGLRRLVDGEVEHEYEVNRRKRKLLGQLLASVAE